MKFKHLRYILSAAFLLSAAGGANAAVIDFEDVAVASGTYTGAAIVNGDFNSGGFQFDFSTDHHHLANDVFYNSNGTTYLGVDDWNGNEVLTMSLLGGGLFDLASIDFGEFDSLTSTSAISVSGSGGENILITLDGIGDGVGGVTDFQNELFGWTNLSWVTFDAVDEGTGVHSWSMDNINVSYSSVPETGTIAMLGLGLLGLGFGRRRK